jgi:hypothetical protein
MLASLTAPAGSVTLLATMRTSEYDRFAARTESTINNQNRSAWRASREVLRGAHVISMDRLWSPSELAGAAKFADDPRVARALERADIFGVAETLTAGPELVRDWRNAWAPGAHPPIATRSRRETGASTVPGLTRTAVNCCRRTRHVPGFLYFRRSDGWGSSDNIPSGQGVAVPAPGRCDQARVTQSTGMRAAVGPHPGFRVSFRFRLVGMWGAAAGDHEGTSPLLASDSPAEHRHVAVSRA